MPHFERYGPVDPPGAGEEACIVRHKHPLPEYIVQDTSRDTGNEDNHQIDPTLRASAELAVAFRFFNAQLFAARLPDCLVTLQRHRGAFGYFANRRLRTRDGTVVLDEIALNPNHFAIRTTIQILSTLVHEMVHCEQEHFGRPSPHGYHNRQFAGMMRQVGLITSDTGAAGGRETGRSMSHYIDPAGSFAVAADDLIARGFDITYVDAWAMGGGDAAGGPPAPSGADAKRASKTRFTCPRCQAAAWGKPSLRIDCHPCSLPMLADGQALPLPGGDVKPPMFLGPTAPMRRILP